MIYKGWIMNEGNVFDQTKEEIINNIFDFNRLCFGRWDIRIIKNWEQDWSDEDMFKARKHSPFFYGPKESTLDLVLTRISLIRSKKCGRCLIQ